MITKTYRLIPEIMAAIFILFGASSCSTNIPPDSTTQTQSEPPTIFKCVRQGSGWATIAQKGTFVVSPLITWNTTEFGSEYTPEERCNIVSPKLTKAVADNGGKLGYLKLTVGSVNNQKVVCVLSHGQTSCNSENLLFTLNQNNSQKSEEVVAKIFNVSRGNASSNIIEENGGSASILLENLIEPKL
ncbi:COP23 domain-containing protein [Microcoleus sp. D2_18a_D3]|uniref:COP23 domain-containing protein n=1 Tax=Microcoleus sp. D2_18a_D3 TaxID=3055330 RepID=UPI002FD5D7C5